jgi:hypothetical protein
MPVRILGRLLAIYQRQAYGGCYVLRVTYCDMVILSRHTHGLYRNL